MMSDRVKLLCQQLGPVLGARIDRLWQAHLATTDHKRRADLEQMLELLAAKYLGKSFQPDREPFPPTAGSQASGDIPLGDVYYAGKRLGPFALNSDRLTEHALICGRSGSGKSNCAFVLMDGLLKTGIKVCALDFKRSYRNLAALYPELRVYTVGRSVSPFRFNPLIPPPGCEPNLHIKQVVDVLANAYLGGDGVISLLVNGITTLFRKHGAFEPSPTSYPTIPELLEWLRSEKLYGRAGMWKASAERILLGMTYGDFGEALNTRSNDHVQQLLDYNAILELDGLPSAADRVMFSEALMLYLYRLRLAQGSRDRLTNVLLVEEAHNLLLAKQAGAKESVLEGAIRQVREYGLGFVFVDQSASLLSRVAFANSYATIALSQKLRADVQTMAGAMNLNDEQKAALNTLPVGTAVVRLADGHAEPFLIRLPKSRVRNGAVTDAETAQFMRGNSADSSLQTTPQHETRAISALPTSDREVEKSPPTALQAVHQSSPANELLSRDALRFITDIVSYPLSSTVVRYGRLHLSRRQGNTLRRELLAAGLIAAVPLPTRNGQVVLLELTESGAVLASHHGLEVPPAPVESLEHRYWVRRMGQQFENDGYEVSYEYALPDGGHVDVWAERVGRRVAIEVETGKSDIDANITKLSKVDIDQVIVLATSPAAMAACQRVTTKRDDDARVELWSWLDVK